MEYATILYLLIFAHCIADYHLQNDFIAQGKNRHTREGKHIWPFVLGTHSLFHGGCVFLVTHSLTLALAETVCHFVIDFCKCERWIGFGTDQTLHLICKVVWAALFVAGYDWLLIS